MTAADILERFSREAPIATMTQGIIEHLFSDDTLNAVPVGVELLTYTRSIDFATLVRLMADVVFRVHPSTRAAYFHSHHAQTVATLKSFYDKFNHVEPAVCRALVRDLARRCSDILHAAPPPGPPPPIRYLTLDGNKLAATQRRLDGLEPVYAPLPGQILVLQDADTGLFLDALPWEDAYTNERALLDDLAGWWAAGDCVVADSGFCTEAMFRQLGAAGAYAVIRHHGSVGLHPVGPERELGRVAGGRAYECSVRYAETDLVRRCVRVELDEPTRAGQAEIRVLATLPETIDGQTVAKRYLGRRGIEVSFQELEAAFRSEVNTLAYPRAALFGFCVGLVLYDLLEVVRQVATGSAAEVEPLSGVRLGQEVSTYLGPLRVLGPLVGWPTGGWSAGKVRNWLGSIARRVDWRRYRKSKRSEKKKKPFPGGRAKSPHASTARIIKDRKKGPAPP